jgi:ubiquinone/menaquinone biosynthesis C-methylase UbiE
MKSSDINPTFSGVVKMKMGKLEKKLVNSKKREESNIQLIEHFFAQSGIDLHNVNKVLDIGCGVGFVARYLNDRYEMEVIGIDVDPEQVEFAKEYSKENEELHFTVADATRLPFEDNQFDLVLSFMVVHHIGDWKRVLEEIDRVLRPNGAYILYEVTYPKFIAKVLRPVAKNYGIFTGDDLSDYLANNGYEAIYEEKKMHLVLKVIGLVTHRE